MMDLEGAMRAQIAAHQLQRLQKGLRRISTHNRFYERKFASAGLNIDGIRSIADLAWLPFTVKRELVADQEEYPPFGSNLTYAPSAYIRLHQTSGTTGHPLKILDTQESWDWWAKCWETVYRAAGVTKEDILFLAFGFGPFIGFWSAYEGAKRIGTLTVPGGGMTSLQRLQVLQDVGATVLVCTPSYALHLAEIAREQHIPLHKSRIRLTIHAGEPGASIPATRKRIEEAWGTETFDHAGMTEMGAYGFTCSAHTGIHVNEEEFIAEILQPHSGQAVAEGEKGELVLTNLGRWGSPALRYRTGDLVEHGGYACACGRGSLLLKGGILGRVDDMLIVRGVNLYPSALAGVLHRFPEIAEYQVLVTRDGRMDEITLKVECPTELIPRLQEDLRLAFNLRIPIEVVEPQTLPRFELKARRVIDQRPRA
ncbi:coenzyme F390 synthetase [Ktedonobacter sp. SOSP1-85]|uniref:phenylacetate--CoA ligase family protein n=1 Tax=Ktedonobacter sp. SOSP1-85 TaxID=2778367 RepID=UPI0019167559|nr:AMP-binding protein [Ktedonobacter sp. SOSP1-85]GHO81131.1 coenzyme F390 synthetase [Ktedonobacter sp. SOSP1-85]